MTYEKEGISQYHHITYNHEREEIAQKHYKFLEELKKFVSNGNYCKGSASEFGKPIVNESMLNRYFQSRHFYKNFYTNYHALCNLFYRQHVVIPQKFYVYDIACGPYTASITLLNFLHIENNLKGKSFNLEFCDKNDWLLQKLYNHNINSKNILSFPVDLKLLCLPEYPNIIKDFELTSWDIIIKVCSEFNFEYYGCKKLSIQSNSTLNTFSNNAVNLVFISYPGTFPNMPKFIKCLSELINSFSANQNRLPTYIIYSHYKEICLKLDCNTFHKLFIQFQQSKISYNLFESLKKLQNEEKEFVKKDFLKFIKSNIQYPLTLQDESNILYAAKKTDQYYENYSRRKTQNDMKAIRDKNLIFITDNGNEAVPFNNYYYSIFKYEAHR